MWKCRNCNVEFEIKEVKNKKYELDKYGLPVSYEKKEYTSIICSCNAVIVNHLIESKAGRYFISNKLEQIGYWSVEKGNE